MKLYCIKVQYKDKTMTRENGLDVIHMLANNSKEIHERMNSHMAECAKYCFPIKTYSFFEIQTVDNFNLVSLLENY